MSNADFETSDAFQTVFTQYFGSEIVPEAPEPVVVAQQVDKDMVTQKTGGDNLTFGKEEIVMPSNNEMMET